VPGAELAGCARLCSGENHFAHYARTIFPAQSCTGWVRKIDIQSIKYLSIFCCETSHKPNSF
jgi:hypothetical protein